MERLVALGAVLAFVSVCYTTPQNGATVVVDNGNVRIGLISGGTFGPGSFSIGQNGSSRRGQTHVHMNEDSDGEHIFVQATNHDGQQDSNRSPQHDNAEPANSGGTNSGNTQLYPVKPLTTFVNTGQRGMPGEGGSKGGSIVIGALHTSNGGNNGFPSVGVSFSSGGSIAIGAITGGNFGVETLSLNHNKRPGTIVPQQQSAANNEDIGYQNTGSEAAFSIGHGVNSPENGNAEVGYTHGQNRSNEQSIDIDPSAIKAIFGSNSGNNKLSSEGNGFSISGPGSVAIGANTEGNFGVETLSLNHNKRPGTIVPQQQGAANNGDIGYQNTGSEAAFSIGHGVNSPENGKAEVGYTHGQNKGNEQFIDIDPSAIKAIFGSNSVKNQLSSEENGFSISGQGSVAIGANTGGNFGVETLSLNHNKRPGTIVPQQQGAANNGDIGYQNTGSEAAFSIGHGVNSPENGNAEVGYTHGQNKSNEQSIDIDPSAIKAIFGSNSGNNKLSSEGNGFSISGPGSVAIGANTEGNFGVETLSLNHNKRPGTIVPQQQGAANNGDIGYQNTGSEAAFSIGHGVNSPENGKAEVGYTHGQNKGNEQFIDIDPSAIKAIFGSNSVKNQLSSEENGFSISGQGSVAIGANTGGNFGVETLSLNHNKRPGTIVPQQQGAANNGDIGYQNTGSEAAFSIGHGVNSPENGNAEVGYTHGQNKSNEQSIDIDPSAIKAIFGSNSGNNELSSEENVTIGANTGGNLGEGTLSVNNKRPGVNIPQQQSTVNNELNMGYHNTGIEAPLSIEYGANSNGNGYAEGQSSTGYNAYNNEEPWIWNR